MDDDEVEVEDTERMRLVKVSPSPQAQGEDFEEEKKPEIVETGKGARSPKKKRKQKVARMSLQSIDDSEASDVPLDNDDGTIVVGKQNARIILNENGKKIRRTSPVGGDKDLDWQVSESLSLRELRKWKAKMDNPHFSLHQLARDGDVKHLRQVLDSCSTLSIMRKMINHFDEDKLTPLHYAARYSRFPVVKVLVERGADVNISGETKITPLHFAARYKRARAGEPDSDQTSKKRTSSWGGGNRESVSHLRRRKTTSPRLSPVSSVQEDNLETESIITFLVASGAELNAKDIYGLTPLHFAAMRHNAVVAEELLKCDGIQSDVQDQQLMTPLHAACSHGSVDCAKLLLKDGANILVKDETKNTPLHLAAQDGHINIVRILLDYGQMQQITNTVVNMLQAQDYEGNTPLMLAVNSGNYEIAKILLEYGADANTHRAMHITALHDACVAGDIRIVELLVEHGAKIDARNLEQATPLHKTCSFDHVEILDFLVAKGANLEATDRDGFTPLLIACCEDYPNMVISLIQHNANVGALDKMDRTSIYLAAENNNLDTLEALFDNSEEALSLIDKGNRYMDTPLHVACTNGFLEIVSCLLENGAEIDTKNEEEKTPLHLAAVEGRTRVVRELVKKSKLTVAGEDEECNTPLHTAASKGHDMVCRELIESGAQIAARNAFLWTPLDCAAANGWERTTSLLLDYDAPVDPVDKARITPLHLASREGHVEVVRLLLERGASIGLLDHHGYNCLDHAIERNHKEVASVIVKNKRWKEALRNSRMIEDHTGAKVRVTPLRQLIKTLPEVAEEVFDQCTVAREHPESPNYRITFNYEFLDDTYCDWRPDRDSFSDSPSALSYASKSSSHKECFDHEGKLLDGAKPYEKDPDKITANHPLNIMVISEREKLLSHPLAISLLRHKWNAYGKYAYYGGLLLYSIYLAFLTGYVVTTEAPYQLRQNLTKEQRSYTFDQVCAMNVDKFKQSHYAFTAKFLLIALTVLHISKEVFQFIQRKYNYFSWENLIEWVVYVSAVLLVGDFSQCTQSTGIRYPWQWQVGAVAIFLAWMNLVLFIRKFPRFGIYVVMFTDVLRTFSRFFLVFFLFLVAFALAFFALFQNQHPFRDVPHSLIKTAVMTIGEFDFTDIFSVAKADHDEEVYYSLVAYLLFSAFIILMTILIMNLLIGLAVDDIKGVQEKAVLKKLAMQVELVLHVEQIMPECLKRRWVRGKNKIHPNQRPTIRQLQRVIFGAPTQLSVTTIAQQLNREKDEMTKIKLFQEKMYVKMEHMRKRVGNMQNQQERLHSMMQAILEHFEIHWEDQDEFTNS